MDSRFGKLCSGSEKLSSLWTASSSRCLCWEAPSKMEGRVLVFNNEGNNIHLNAEVYRVCQETNEVQYYKNMQLKYISMIGHVRHIEMWTWQAGKHCQMVLYCHVVLLCALYFTAPSDNPKYNILIQNFI